MRDISILVMVAGGGLLCLLVGLLAGLLLASRGRTPDDFDGFIEMRPRPFFGNDDSVFRDDKPENWLLRNNREDGK